MKSIKMKNNMMLMLIVVVNMLMKIFFKLAYN